MLPQNPCSVLIIIAEQEQTDFDFHNNLQLSAVKSPNWTERLLTRKRYEGFHLGKNIEESRDKGYENQ